MERFPGVCGLHVTTGSLEVEEKGGARVRVETSKMDCGCVWGGGGEEHEPGDAGASGSWKGRDMDPPRAPRGAQSCPHLVSPARPTGAPISRTLK